MATSLPLIAPRVLAWSEALGTWPHWDLHSEMSGWTPEFIPERIPELWVAVAFAALWFCMRVICKKFVFPRLAALIYITPARKARTTKFAYQMWLLSYYTISSVGGYFLLRDELFFAFPVGAESGAHLFNQHPYPFTDPIWWYHHYALGFYIAELFAIFIEPKRSDFVEYLLHHLVTIILVTASLLTHSQRIGAYILFIHDVPDIFLSLAKCLNYSPNKKIESIANVAFGFFVVTFAFFRLYCLPHLTWVAFCVAPFVRPATYGHSIFNALYGVVLQALHVFWFYLIIRMIVRLAMGVRADVRSDEDAEQISDQKQKKQR